MNQDVHVGGMFASVGLAAFATIGANLTTFRGIGQWDAVWISLFVISVLLLSAAAANFELKRWLW